MSQVLISAAALTMLALFAVSSLVYMSYSASSIFTASHYMSRLSREQLSGKVVSADLYTYAITVTNSGSEPVRIKSSGLELLIGCQGEPVSRQRIYIDLGQRVLLSSEKWIQAVRIDSYSSAIESIKSLCIDTLKTSVDVSGSLSIQTENSGSYRFPLEKRGDILVITPEDVDAGVAQKILPNGRVITIYVREVLACFASPSSYFYYSYVPQREAPIAVDIYFGDSRGNVVNMPVLGGSWQGNIRLTLSDFSASVEARCKLAKLDGNVQMIKYLIQGQRSLPSYVYSGVFFGVAIIVNDLGPGLRIERIDTGFDPSKASSGVFETYAAYHRADPRDPLSPIVYMFTPEFLTKLRDRKAIFQGFSGILLVGQAYLDTLPTLGYEKNVAMTVKLPIIIYLSQESR
ncbi:MAG: hypothetical protein QXI64_10045 [Sulfolobales archaeon]